MEHEKLFVIGKAAEAYRQFLQIAPMNKWDRLAGAIARILRPVEQEGQ
jgi:hypothetical protein